MSLSTIDLIVVIAYAIGDCPELGVDPFEIAREIIVIEG
jgi:hypothetical protein